MCQVKRKGGGTEKDHTEWVHVTLSDRLVIGWLISRTMTHLDTQTLICSGMFSRQDLLVMHWRLTCQETICFHHLWHIDTHMSPVLLKTYRTMTEKTACWIADMSHDSAVMTLHCSSFFEEIVCVGQIQPSCNMRFCLVSVFFYCFHLVGFYILHYNQ